jgi:hypothetical protein
MPEYRVKDGRTFQSADKLYNAGDLVSYPAGVDVSAFYDLLDPVKEAKPEAVTVEKKEPKPKGKKK